MSDTDALTPTAAHQPDLDRGGHLVRISQVKEMWIRRQYANIFEANVS